MSQDDLMVEPSSHLIYFSTTGIRKALSNKSPLLLRECILPGF
jgi:hypothetical protein